MKKLFAMLLALCLMASLAACGEDVPTTAQNSTKPTANQTAKPKSAELVSGYVGLIGTLEFDYNADLSGGKIHCTDQDGVVREGTFTCDENYNLTHLEIPGASDTMLVECRFDTAYRLLYLQILLKNETGTTLYMETSNRYDSHNRNIYTSNKTETIFSEMHSEYNDKGFVVKQINRQELNGNTVEYTTEYTYDEQGHMLTQSQTMDGQTEALNFTWEEKDGLVYCTNVRDSVTTVYGYDDRGNQVLVDISLNGRRVQYVKREYNQMNLLVDQLIEVVDQLPNRQTYQYNENGRQTLVIQYMDGQEMMRMVTTFKTVEIPE